MSIDSGKHFGDFVKQFVKGSAVEKLSTGGPPEGGQFYVMAKDDRGRKDRPLNLAYSCANVVLFIVKTANAV